MENSKIKIDLIRNLDPIFFDNRYLNNLDLNVKDNLKEEY